MGIWVAGWGATPEETQAFEVAARQLEDGLCEQAAASFAAYVTQYPNGERVGEARTLAAHAQAGSLLQRGDLAGAAAAYAKVLADYPESPHRVAALLGEATARYRLGDYTNVVALTGGVSVPSAEAGAAVVERAVRCVLLQAEAQLRLGQTGPGLEAVGRVGAVEVAAGLAWERQYVLARLQLAAAQNEAALGTVTNLLSLSTNVVRLAEAEGLHGEALERLGRADDAIQAYEKNLGAGTPGARRRQAQLKVVELLAARNRGAEAAKRIEGFLAEAGGETPVEVLRLTLGELRLKEYYALAPEARKGGTNLLWQALAQADQVVTNAEGGEWVGRAQWGRGWCWWELAQGGGGQDRWVEAAAAFRAAAEGLAEGADQASARFKWADCQFQLKDYSGAVSNYWWGIERYGGMAEVREAWFELALWQIVRAGVEMGDMGVADKAVGRLVAEFPQSAYADRALLLLGQALTGKGELALARTRLTDLVKRFPSSPLLPEARRALARAYVQEGNWSAAISEVDGWLGAYPEHPKRPEVEFDRAWLYWQSGLVTNAFQRFTNFVAQFPTNALAPQAQLWIGDYYFDQGDFARAELNYQLLFQNTNWVGSGLTGRARLMAGRAAFSREGYASAEGYFLWLVTNAPAGDPIVAEALFDLGNSFTARPAAETTNVLANFENAINAFTRITQQHATNRLAPLAWGRMGDCHLQLASADPRRYERATNAYARVVESPLAGLAARSKAEVGIGTALEKMAGLAGEAERDALLSQALDRYAAVLYESNRRPNETEPADPLWVKEAGLAAARVAEAQHRWEVAARIYGRLAERFPPLRPALEKRRTAAVDQVEAAPP